MWGVLLRTEFSKTYFRGPNCNESNCSEANSQEPSCPGPNTAERLHRAELSRADSSEPSFPNTKYWNNISRKAVHVVILGVTIAYVRWCIDYEKKHTQKSVMIKHIDMSLVKTYWWIKVHFKRWCKVSQNVVWGVPNNTWDKSSRYQTVLARWLKRLVTRYQYH